MHLPSISATLRRTLLLLLSGIVTHFVESWTIFQEPPKPLAVWQDPVKLSKTFVRPKEWEDKDFGQWCRNFTANKHVQCPEATPFHWYVCCGEHNSECCVGLQTWVYVVFGPLIIAALVIATFFLLLHFNLLCREEVRKKISSAASSTAPASHSGYEPMATTVGSSKSCSPTVDGRESQLSSS